MKRILKFFPVALGVLALASCSNDNDFFGSVNKSGKLELIATVEAPAGSDDVTRSATTSGPNLSDYSTIWQDGDAFRVYDEALQKYDVFSCKDENGTKAITIDDDPADVQAHTKALFPAENVFYAGWDKTNKVVKAVMKIKDNWIAGAREISGTKVGYVSNLPMWGDVTNETAENLEVSLKALTAYIDFTVYKNALIDKIRVISADKADYEANQATFETDVITGDLNLDAPLTGYFEAELKAGGKLTVGNEAVQAGYGSVITVNVNNAAFNDETHIFIPVIAQTYEKLVIQYHEIGAASWTVKKVFTDQAIANNIVIRNGLTLGQPATEIQVTSLADLNTKLATAAAMAGNVINVTLKDGGSLVTANAAQTLTIPNVAKNLFINIDASITATAKPLFIAGGNAAYTAVLNIEQGVLGNQGVTVATDGALALGGSYAGNMTITSAKDVTLGLGEFASFTTNNVVKNAATGDVYVAANEGTIADISLFNAADANNIIVESGTVTNIGNARGAAGAVTVNGGTLTTIKTTTGAITVNGGIATNLITTTGDLTIGADATVSTVTTSATNFNAGSDLQKLTLTGAGNVALNVTATIEEIEAAYRDDAVQATITITSQGNASIKKVTNNNGTRTTIAYGAATWIGGGEPAAEAEAVNGVIPVYTVSQLASMTTGKKYKLMAESYDISGQVWTPVNISDNFDGSSKTITGLTNSLFGTISGGTIKDLTLASVANATAANTGALAATVTGSPTIQKISVTSGNVGADKGEGAGFANANSKNIGGLVGTVNGTAVNFLDNKVVATVKGYANVGGLIGNVAGGTVNIKTSKDDNTYQSNVTFNKTYKPTVAATASDANCGTFGNLIGSITGSGVTVFIGGTATGKGAAYDKFFTDKINANKAVHATDVTKLDFSYNRTFSGGAVATTFSGATTVGGTVFNNVIGYSTGSISKLTIYNTTENNLGYDWTINDVNVFVAP